MAIDAQLSRAIVLYFSHHDYPVEEQGDAELAAAFSEEEHAVLRAQIRDLINRAFEIGTGFARLEPAAEAVTDFLRKGNPELSGPAIEALMWYWNYCNR
jgi:hypothetical protein